MFPQIKEFNKDIIKYHINKDAIDVDVNLPQNAYIKNTVCWVMRWEDENINKSCDGINGIQSMIENSGIYCTEEIFQNFRRQIEKLRKREEKCDIKISDYIENNYREKQLFYDPNHPTNKVIYEKGRQIMSVLDLNIVKNKLVDDEMDQGRYLYMDVFEKR